MSNNKKIDPLPTLISEAYSELWDENLYPEDVPGDLVNLIRHVIDNVMKMSEDEIKLVKSHGMSDFAFAYRVARRFMVNRYKRPEEVTWEQVREYDIKKFGEPETEREWIGSKYVVSRDVKTEPLESFTSLLQEEPEPETEQEWIERNFVVDRDDYESY